MLVKHAVAIVAVLCAGFGLTGSAEAQRLVFRLGGGPAIMSDVGIAGQVALEGRSGLLVVRVEARPVFVQGVHEGGYGGGAIGLAARKHSAFGRPYVLGTLARGLDVREGDWATAAGLTLGSDFNRGLFGAFGELRYEHPFQERPIYYRLPPDQVTLMLGVRVGRP